MIDKSNETGYTSIEISPRLGKGYSWCKGRPRSKSMSTYLRKLRRLDQEIMFLDKTYMSYNKTIFGGNIFPKNYWNEGIDFKAATSIK